MPEEQPLLEVWKVTIDLQKHFNDLSMRVRNFAITVLGAFLAAAGYAAKDEATVTLLNTTFSLTGWILLAGLLCWFSFYLMDLHWYHRLLRGAVIHGRAVEKALAPQIPQIGLTEAIDAASPIYGLRASQRLTIFYGAIGVLLLAAALAAFHVRTAWYIALAVAVLIGMAGIFLTRAKSDLSQFREQPTEPAPPR